MRKTGIVLTTIVVTALVVLIAAAVAIISGAYNFAADAPHTAIVKRIIAIARDRSVDVRASGIKAPPLDKPAMIAEGAEHYAAMCAGCHLAPGMKENEMRPGLNPKPPILASMPADDPAEQFWIVKHGLKMTAMPAWGVTHSDEELWNIVAFLQKLPSMPVAQYQALTRNAEAHHEHMEMH